MRKLLVLVAAGLGLGLGATACNPVTPYAAVVNGTVISQSTLNAELAAIAGNQSDVASIQSASASNGSSIKIRGAGSDTYGSTFAADVLRQEILYVLIGQELTRRHVKVTAYDLRAARADVPGALQGQGTTAVDVNDFPASYRRTLVTRQAELEALEASLSHVTLSAAAVQDYYETHSSEFFEACASRILVTSLAAAAQVESDLAKGTAFSAEAAAKSQDTQTSSQGGELGCGSGLQFSSALGASFAKAVETTPVGRPSAPILDASGFDIVEVSERSPLSGSAIDSQIRQELTSAGGNQLDTVLGRDVAAARVTVDARYGAWSAKGINGVTGVVPPALPQVRSDYTTATTLSPSTVSP